jgi:hypothetical protein
MQIAATALSSLSTPKVLEVRKDGQSGKMALRTAQLTVAGMHPLKP